VRGFGELETVIMDRVWELGRVTTVREVYEQLAREREIAYTTVLSTMDNLHRKGWLSRERDGKAFRYWATLSREEYSARVMRDALDAGGDPDLVLTRFLEQMSDEETARLRDVVRKWGRGRRRA
jgi:predicted transcriptional regulator